MGDDKFKQFMKSVESVTTGLTDIQASYDTNEEREVEKKMAVTPDGTIVEVELTEEEIAPQTDGILVKENQNSAESNSKQGVTIEEAIVEKGSNFLEGLLNILSNPESTQRLVSNITETDKTTGQTYLKLPISNAGVVENALKVLSGLFGGLGK